MPMRNILVPQTGQTPWVAGLPFFRVTGLASFISLLARHFTHYACIVVLFWLFLSQPSKYAAYLSRWVRKRFSKIATKPLDNLLHICYTSSIELQ